MTTRLLFVCMGNICRSPTAEAVMRERVESRGLADRFYIDSAGTHGYHVGAPPDTRSQETAMARGLDMSEQRSRRVSPDDLHGFDHILVMDAANLDALKIMQAEHGGKAVIERLLDFAPGRAGQDVPDPYYGGDRGFEQVFDLITAGCDGLLDSLGHSGN